MLEYKLEELAATDLPLVVQKLKLPSCQVIHRHNAVELVYICHGAGWCAVNGIVHPMLTGDLYMISVGATHEYHSDADLCYVNCLFDKNIFRDDEIELFRYFSGNDPEQMLDKYTFGPHLQKKISFLLDELNEELNTDRPFNMLRARALFIDLLIFILRNAVLSPGIRASHAQKHLGKVLSYITDNLNAKLSMKHLAEISGYAPDYFGKLFRKELGIGLSEYICNRRLERACYELEHSAMSIDEIAVRTGFFDASYFIKMFRKHCGITPAQFRRNIQAEHERKIIQ
ncbi:MAG: helix-turn-helix domain-containing protein [Lentisphaeria bacterium]|nr:helix-turn-helix domain-containing protein [Lentisphaeria bacterium]